MIHNLRIPKFPVDISIGKAEKGFAVYQASCSQCHGSYSMTGPDVKLLDFPNKFVAQNEIKTDPYRWKAFSPELENKMNSVSTGQFVEARHQQGYVAPLLSSLWMTAPYLHNGSVPTLWHLMYPEKRPAKFLVGGHHLDFAKMGILLNEDGETYPDHVKPTSLPESYQTMEPGRSNRGHESPFTEMSDEEKNNLLEFLKLL
jgi:hypothetical protein